MAASRPPPRARRGEGKRGGKLTALWGGDVDFIDPGQTYYQPGQQVADATQSTLYAPKVDDASVAEPLLAESDPQVSEDGCTVTVTIKEGVKFSPPVDRAVTSADVKYAIERGFFNSVNNGYAGAYFGDLRGAKVGAKPGTEIPGIETPDDKTVVFNLKPREAGQVHRRRVGGRARDAALRAGAEGLRGRVRRQGDDDVR